VFAEVAVHTYLKACQCLDALPGIPCALDLILAFITGNSILEPLLEGLLAQIHIHMS